MNFKLSSGSWERHRRHHVDEIAVIKPRTSQGAPGAKTAGSGSPVVSDRNLVLIALNVTMKYSQKKSTHVQRQRMAIVPSVIGIVIPLHQVKTTGGPAAPGGARVGVAIVVPAIMACTVLNSKQMVTTNQKRKVTMFVTHMLIQVLTATCGIPLMGG